MSSSSSQKIGVATATIVGMNAMIGVGIFAVPAALASKVGPAGLLTYAFVIVAVWCMAHSFARVAQLFPEEGSFYTYAKQWGGHKLGLLSAGAYLLGLLIAMGLLAQVAGIQLAKDFPSLTAFQLGLIVIGTLTALNIKGVSLSERGQQILIICTTFPLIATTIMCLTKADLSNLTPFMPYGFTNVLAATRAVIFGFFGFEAAASLFTIVENPKKNVPRALTYSIMLVGTLYLAFVGSIILSTPLSLFTDPSVQVDDILATIFPAQRWAITGIHISILAAILGTIHSMIWSSSMFLLSLCKKIQLPIIKESIKKGILNPKSCVFLVGLCITFNYFTLKSIDLFFSLTALFIVFALVTSMITLLKLPSEWKSKQNYITLIGLATAGVIFFFALQGLIQEL